MRDPGTCRDVGFPAGGMALLSITIRGRSGYRDTSAQRQ